MPPSLGRQIAVLTDIAAADLAPVWTLPPQEATDALFAVLPAAIDAWSLAAGALAADWYDTLRESENVPGRFTAIIPPLGDKGAAQLAGWAGQALMSDEPDYMLARSRVDGGMQRRIANTARETVMASTVADKVSNGWQRETEGPSCAFCVLLAGRGFVYKTQETAAFGAHDKCDCWAVPVWGGRIKVRPYEPSKRREPGGDVVPITPAERDAIDKWIEEHVGDFGFEIPGAA